MTKLRIRPLNILGPSLSTENEDQPDPGFGPTLYFDATYSDRIPLAKSGASPTVAFPLKRKSFSSEKKFVLGHTTQKALKVLKKGLDFFFFMGRVLFQSNSLLETP